MDIIEHSTASITKICEAIASIQTNMSTIRGALHTKRVPLIWVEPTEKVFRSIQDALHTWQKELKLNTGYWTELEKATAAIPPRK